VGTPEAPGSTLITVTGAVRSPGVVEVGIGTPVVEILGRVGVDGELSAVLVGGYGGAWLDASRLATPYGPGPLADAGAAHGVGVVIALPATACGITETARLGRYLAGESTGQCGPCVFGLPAIAGDLEQLSAGRADAGVLDRIQARSATVEGRGGCRHPDGVIRLVRSALEVFAADDAYGYCAELLPERVTLDEWGYPMVDGTPVAGDLAALATRAAAECPRRAVLLERVAAARQK
jgi:NADH:ubiquinone oxidoreductase subunit F (NADH-binding)